MRCNTCKEYIYKGKKFNSRKEDVVNEFYLGLRIFRFYIKCPRCVSEIAFKTDIENIDYTLEAGATRLFEAEKLARQMEEQERKQQEEDELNPMKVLENRTKASIQEMDQIDSLEELREINSRKNVVNTDEMLEKYRRYEQLLQQLQMEEEEKEIREIFGSEGSKIVKRLHDSDSDGDEPAPKKVVPRHDKPTDIFAQDAKTEGKVDKKPEVWQRSIGSLSTKQKLSGLVKKKSNLPVVSNKTSSQASSTDVEKNTLVEDCSQRKQADASNAIDEVRVNQTCTSCDSSAANKSAIQNDRNTSNMAGSTDEINEDSSTVKRKVLEVDENDTDSDKVRPDDNVYRKESAKNTVSEQKIKDSTSSGALGLLGAYSDSESGESD